MTETWEKAPNKSGYYWGYHPKRYKGKTVLCEVFYEHEHEWHVRILIPKDTTQFYKKAHFDGWVFKRVFTPHPPGVPLSEGERSRRPGV